MEESKYRYILLVDDDADDQLLFNDAIHNVDSSIRFDKADNGLHALNKLLSTKLLPDLIFVDLNMPRMDGFEFLSQIKKEPALQRIAVIAFTTSKSVVDAERAHALGADGFLTKPQSYKELCSKLRRIIHTDFSTLSKDYKENEHAF